MNKVEAIYKNILYLLKNLTTEADNFSDYLNPLDGGKQDNLISLAEIIENEISEIISSKEQGLIFSNSLPLLSALETFLEDFNDYPNHRLDEIIVLIKLLARLSDAIDEVIDPADTINIELFSLVKLEKHIHHNNFVFYDSATLNNSICLLDFANLNSISTFLNSVALPVELYFHLLTKIGTEDHIIEKQKYVLIKSDQKDKKAAVWSCVAVHLVKAGHLVHEPYSVDTIPTVSNSRVVKAGEIYQQFNDSIIILSEYNDQVDILDKYLRLYHVIENFMYKFPLVALERYHNGSVFSMRDFQKMNEKLDNSELTSLTNLFKKILEKDYSVGTKFDAYILQLWTDILPFIANDKSKVDLLLSLLRISTKTKDYTFDDVKLDNISSFFPKLIYAYRNSIVHNRETEFHLNHETLLYHSTFGNTAKVMLEKFLIPVLEEVIFFLILERNEIVWFKNSTIKLWDEQ